MKIKHSNTLRVTKRKLFERLSVTTINVTLKSKKFLKFSPNPNLVTQRGLLANGIVGAISNRSIYVLVTKNPSKQNQFDKYRVLGLWNDNICTIVSSRALQKSSQDEQSL